MAGKGKCQEGRREIFSGRSIVDEWDKLNNDEVKADIIEN